MVGSLDQVDRRAFTAGALALVALVVAYPFLAEVSARPLGVFVLPSLLTAVLGGWRPTVIVGCASVLVAVGFGVAGPLGPAALTARWVIVVLGAVMGAVGATVRQRQATRLSELQDAVALRKAFERALAPSPVPPPGFLAVARYVTADARMQLGGDFLEAIALADGRLAVLIGDVCGHGPREAAFGAALRAGWKSIALGDKHDPVEWVEALNVSFFEDGRMDTFATICTGYLDLDSRVARLVNLGHPPPVSLQGTPRPLDLPPSPPLGTGWAEGWNATEVPWRGDPLLFYTDGLIENPQRAGDPRRWGEDGLLAWLRQQLPVTNPRRLADELLQAATADRTSHDDIALLLVAADSSRA